MKLRLDSTALDGRTVTLTLLQEGVSVGPLSVNAWGTPEVVRTASIDVAVSRSVLLTAPEPVFFKVTGWTGFDTGPGPIDGHDRRHHEIVYLWDFGDPGATFARPVNVLAEWRDANLGYGAFVAHVYARPGTYTASCLAVEMGTGRTAEFQRTIAVADPEVTFGGGRTAYVATDGDFSDCPSTVVPSKRFIRIGAALDSFGAGDVGARIMMARGKTHTFGGINRSFAEHASVRAIEVPIHVVAGPGTGARPVCKPSLNPNGRSSTLFSLTGVQKGGEFLISGLDLVGPWNPDDETTTAPYVDCPDAVSVNHKGRTMVHDCSIGGFNHSVIVNPPDRSGVPGATQREQYENVADAIGVVISDSSFGAFRNYGVFATVLRRFALLGTSIVQSPFAVSGGGKAGGTNDVLHNNHGGVRMSLSTRHDVVFDGCDLYTRTGWFPNGAWLTEQPCLRVNQAMLPDCHYNLQRSGFEGGFPLIAIARVNNNVPGGPSDLLVDHCYLTGSHMTGMMVQGEGTGFTVRNSVLTFPDVPRLQGLYEPRGFIAVTDTGGPRGMHFDLPLQVYGNTLVNLMSAANRGVDYPVVYNNSGTELTAVLVENNVLHAPNLAAPRVDFAPLDATVRWAPRSLGYKTVWDFLVHTLTAPWPPGASILVPFAPGKVRADYSPNAIQGSAAHAKETIAGERVEFLFLGQHEAGGFRFANGSRYTYSSGLKVGVQLDRRAFPDPLPTAQASPADTVRNGTPLAGSPALGGATSDMVPYDDIRGRARPVHPSVGAFEAAGRHKVRDAAGARIDRPMAQPDPTPPDPTPPDRTPRIAYLTASFPAISHTFILREIEALDALGLDVRPVSIRRAGPEQLIGPAERAAAERTFDVVETARRPRAALAALGAALRRPKPLARAAGLAWRMRPPGARALAYQAIYLAEAMVLARHLRRTGCGHVHVHFANSSATVGLLSATLAGTGFSFTLHGPSDLFEAAHWRLDLKIAAARFVACISHFARSQAMLNSDPVHWSKLGIVHCGVIPERYGPPPQIEPDAPVRLLFVGRLAPVKGLRVLLEALRQARGIRPDLVLTIVGDGPDRAALEALARPLGTAVTFTGALSQADVAARLAASDALVLPSFAEGVPVVLMEAMAAGLPVVATRVAGVPELVEDGVSGHLVAPGDGDGLRAALLALADDPDLRARMGRAGRARVARDFDVRHEAAWLARLFRGEATSALRPEAGEMGGDRRGPRGTGGIRA